MNTNTITSWVQQAVSAVSQLYALPAALLVALSCIVVGYVLKAWQKFPNQAIPTVVVLWAAFLTVVLADVTPAGVGHVAWKVRNALVGMVIGFAAWAFHYYLLSKLEDKVPWLAQILQSKGGGGGGQPPAPAPKP